MKTYVRKFLQKFPPNFLGAHPDVFGCGFPNSHFSYAWTDWLNWSMKVFLVASYIGWPTFMN